MKRTCRVNGRSILVGLAFLASCMSQAQTLRDLSLELRTGPSGMNYQSEISVHLLGAENRTLGSATFRPPRIGSFGANGSESVNIRLDNPVKSRLVKMFQITVRGTRPGNSRFADAWDLAGVTIREGRNTVWAIAGLNERFSELRTSWRSPAWPTFDPAGESTAAEEWQIVTLTGNDDLRADHTMSFMALFDDGSVAGFSLGNIAGRAARVDNLNVAARTKGLNNLVAIAMVPSGNLVPQARNLRTGSVYQPTASEDFWDLSEVTLRLRLPDGDLIQRPVSSLHGRWGFNTMRMHRFKQPDIFVPARLPRSVATTPVTVIVFADGSNFNTTVSDMFADLRAGFGFPGRTSPLGVVYRTIGRDPEPIVRQTAGWLGSLPSGHMNDNFGMLYKTVRPWQSQSGEINSVDLSLAKWNTGGRYTGAATIPIKGYLVLQAKTANQADYSPSSTLNDWVVLGHSFGPGQTLTAQNPSVSFPISYRRRLLTDLIPRGGGTE